jgi:DNA polymerase III subunit chi
VGIVLFYHLTRSAAAETARPLLRRALGEGWRVMIRSPDPARVGHLEANLWLGPEDDFLPHGCEGGPHDADQPILIGAGPIANAAQVLMLLDGAEPLEGEVAALERTWILFDGNDPAQLDAARGQWKALTDTGQSAQYWSEEGGRWEKKAEA